MLSYVASFEESEKRTLRDTIMQFKGHYFFSQVRFVKFLTLSCKASLLLKTAAACF